MGKLTEKEIQDELKRLGITNPSDIESFLMEYEMYIASQQLMLKEIESL
jgi:hypothetical protein